MIRPFTAVLGAVGSLRVAPSVSAPTQARTILVRSTVELEAHGKSLRQSRSTTVLIVCTALWADDTFEFARISALDYSCPAGKCRGGMMSSRSWHSRVSYLLGEPVTLKHKDP